MFEYHHIECDIMRINYKPEDNNNVEIKFC